MSEAPASVDIRTAFAGLPWIETSLDASKGQKMTVVFGGLPILLLGGGGGSGPIRQYGNLLFL